MGSNDSIFAFTAPKPRRDDTTQKPAPANPPACEAAVVLDMGEASRLEGFRLNGCR